MGHFAKCCATNKSVRSVTIDEELNVGFLGTIDNTFNKAWTNFSAWFESQDKFNVQEIHVVKGLTKALLGRPAIQALGIITYVNISSVDVDLVTQKTESYYRARYPKVSNGARVSKLDVYNRVISGCKTVCIVRSERSSIDAYGQSKCRVDENG